MVHCNDYLANFLGVFKVAHGITFLTKIFKKRNTVVDICFSFWLLKNKQDALTAHFSNPLRAKFLCFM